MFLKKLYDRVLGDSHTETTTEYIKGRKIVTVKTYKGSVCIFKNVTTYYPGFSINL